MLVSAAPCGAIVAFLRRLAFDVGVFYRRRLLLSFAYRLLKSCDFVPKNSRVSLSFCEPDTSRVL